MVKKLLALFLVSFMVSSPVKAEGWIPLFRTAATVTGLSSAVLKYAVPPCEGENFGLVKPVHYIPLAYTALDLTTSVLRYCAFRGDETPMEWVSLVFHLFFSTCLNLISICAAGYDGGRLGSFHGFNILGSGMMSLSYLMDYSSSLRKP